MYMPGPSNRSPTWWLLQTQKSQVVGCWHIMLQYSGFRVDVSFRWGFTYKPPSLGTSESRGPIADTATKRPVPWPCHFSSFRSTHQVAPEQHQGCTWCIQKVPDLAGTMMLCVNVLLIGATTKRQKQEVPALPV